MGTLKPQIFQVVGLVAVTTALAVSAQAVVYTNASVKGSYSFLGNKWTADVTSNQDGNLGVLHFDGAGNFTFFFSDLLGGMLTTITGTGTYAVKSNGTGSINITGGGQLAIVLNSTVSGVATSLQLLTTNNTDNSVRSGTAVLQSTAAATYNAASLKGIFGFQLNTWAADVSLGRVGIVGLFNFNGAGKVTASFTQMKGGVLSTGTGTGTYTVNADGTGAMSLTVSTGGTANIALVLNAVAGGHPKGLQLLVTPGTANNEVTSGIALKQ